MKVLRKTDRVRFIIDEVEFTIAPISYRQRIELAEKSKIKNGNTEIDYIEQTRLMIKFGLKKLEGLKDFHGKDYLLAFDSKEEDSLTDDCSDELIQCFKNNKTVEHIIHAASGNAEVIDDVEISVLGK